MSNAIVPVATPFGQIALKNPQAMAAALTSSAQQGQVGMAPAGSDYLNFSGKRGVYEFGKDKTDISPDELWLIDIGSFQSGWVCWKGGSTAAQRLASIYGPAIPQPDFNEFGPFAEGDGWSMAKALVCASIDTEGRQGYFKVSSKSAVGTFSQLEDAVANRIAAGLPCWPLLFWKREKFTAKGKVNSKPTYDIYGWITREAVMDLATSDMNLDDMIAQCEAGTYVQQTAGPVDEPVEEPSEPVVAEPVDEPKPAVVGRRAPASQQTVAADPVTAQLAPGAARRARRGL